MEKILLIFSIIFWGFFPAKSLLAKGEIICLNVNNYQKLETLVESGDTAVFDTGVYHLKETLTIAKCYDQRNPLVIIADGANFKAVDVPRVLDLKGEAIKWRGGIFLGGKKETVGIRGDYIDFSQAKVYGGDKAPYNSRGIGIIGKNNSIHHCEIFNFADIGIDGNGEFYNEKKEIIRPKARTHNRSSQNWHIYNNHIHHIYYKRRGDHEGAMKLVPMVRDVFIYNNLVEDCAGNTLWVDLGEGNIVFYGNVIRRSFRGIFYEISFDEIPDNPFPGSWGCYIVKNRVSSTERQPLLVSASNNTQVFGNIFEGKLPPSFHGMPREIDKIKGEPGTGRMMSLKNNVFRHNVIGRIHGSRSQLAVYDKSTDEAEKDPNAGNNQVYSNFYLTGYKATYKGRIYVFEEPQFAYGKSRATSSYKMLSGVEGDASGKWGNESLELKWSEEEMCLPDFYKKFPFLLNSESPPNH